MPVVNLTEASSLAGVSRTTLYKKIQQGKISLSKLPNGSRGIDVAELGRVFGNLERQRERNQLAHLDVHSDVHRLQAENAMLREQVVMYRTQLEASMHERNRLLSIIEQRLLPAPVEPPRPKVERKLRTKAAPAEKIPKSTHKPTVIRTPKGGLAKPAPNVAAKASPPEPKKMAPVKRASPKAQPTKKNLPAANKAAKTPSQDAAQDSTLAGMFKQRWGSEGGKSARAPARKVSKPTPPKSASKPVVREPAKSASKGKIAKRKAAKNV